jgi:hypothetical protein
MPSPSAGRYGTCVGNRPAATSQAHGTEVENNQKLGIQIWTLTMAAAWLFDCHSILLVKVYFKSITV